jgi:uncharacterized protein YfaS (alpha-2-macroglobulin family)
LKEALQGTGVAVLALEAFKNGTETAAQLKDGRAVTLFTVSNVGMMYASGEGGKVVAVAMDIASGEAVPGVKVKIIAREQSSV